LKHPSAGVDQSLRDLSIPELAIGTKIWSYFSVDGKDYNLWIEGVWISRVEHGMMAIWCIRGRDVAK